MKKERNLTKEATAWAAAQCGTKAKTEKGIEKAVRKWLADKELVTEYINFLQENAEIEMTFAIRHRTDVLADRKNLKKYPVYARFFLAKTTEAKKTYRGKKGTQNLPDYLSSAISKIAYSNIFGGTRCRKKYLGSSAEVAGMRTEDNGKGGWDRVVWHYADYVAILSPDNQLYVDVGDEGKEYMILGNGSTRILGQNIRKPADTSPVTLKPHHLRKIYEGAIRGGALVWRWNLKEKAGEYIHIATGESYHTPAFTREPVKIFLEAVRAFQKRRDEKLATVKRLQSEKVLTEKANVIFVGLEDSYHSGNCKTLTNEFAKSVYEKFGGEVCISAQALLELRDDSYTRRACVEAAKRYI